jgi:hypothetical protein
MRLELRAVQVLINVEMGDCRLNDASSSQADFGLAKGKEVDDRSDTMEG